MVREAVVVVNISGWWHAGTGRGGGEDADALVARDCHGLPFLPGRHLKGLLRDACFRLERWQALEARPAAGAGRPADKIVEGTTDLLFGTDEFEKREAAGQSGGGADDRAASDRRGGRHRTQEGCLTFANAVLPHSVQLALRDPPDATTGLTEQAKLRRGLFGFVSATAIDQKSGVAKDDTLRRIEVAVPLTLRAEVHWEPDPRGLDGGEAQRRAIEDAERSWPDVLRTVLPFVRAVGGHRTRGFGRAKLSLDGAEA